MNPVVIFFVPVGAVRQDFEAALHEQMDSLPAPEASCPKDPGQPPPTGVQELPMWTWFLLNSRPRTF